MFMIITMEHLTERAFAYLFFYLVSVVNVIFGVGNILVFIGVKAEIVLCWIVSFRKRHFLFPRNVYVVNSLIINNFTALILTQELAVGG